MARKEIYAALEIADHEVRLVVGEMVDSRLNILRVERAAGGGGLVPGGLERGLQLPLNGGAVFLRLPSTVGASIIFHQQLDSHI